MYKLVPIALLLLLGGLVCQAQTDTTAKSNVSYFKAHYQLSESQAQHAAAIMDHYKQHIKTLWQNKLLSAPERKRQFHLELKQRNDSLKTFLNAQQLDHLLPTTERNN